MIDRLRSSFGELYLDEAIMEKFYAKWIFRLMGTAFRLGCAPYLRNLFPWIDPKQNHLTCLPVNRDIQGDKDARLTGKVLDHFIEHAKHRVIINICPCRKVLGCRTYPIDIGCMMMGDSSVYIPKKISREVGVDEARAHVKRAVKARLIPTTGRFRIDKDFFAAPDGERLLSLCFCCECCSATRFFRHVPKEKLDGMLFPVEGFFINVTNACDGCGECLPKCHLDAIRIRNGRVVIGARCKACGRCAVHCPPGAIKLALENPDAAQDVVKRIGAAVDY
jgi:UDP-glucose 4-epimerase